MRSRALDRINRIVRIIAFYLLLAAGLVAAMVTPGTARSMTDESVHPCQAGYRDHLMDPRGAAFEAWDSLRSMPPFGDFLL